MSITASRSLASAANRHGTPLRKLASARLLTRPPGIAQLSAAEDASESDACVVLFDNEPRVREYEARWDRILAHYGRPEVVPPTLSLYEPLPDTLPPPIEPPAPDEQVDIFRCIHPGCFRESHAKDYCATHYWRFKNRRPMDMPIRPRPVGSIQRNDPDVPHSVCGVLDWREGRDGYLVCRECERRRVR